jgi:hypothetical protein
VIAHGPEFADYFHKKVNLPYASDTRYIGILRKDLSIAGAVAYNCWLSESVFMHVALEPHVLTTEFLREVFMYPFVTCNKARVYAMTPITSPKALRLSKKIGFKLVAELPDFQLLSMARNECRWINDSSSEFWPRRWNVRPAGTPSGFH